MILLDTSILARLPDAENPDRKAVLSAISKLLRANEALVIFPQNIYEFWAAATRRARRARKRRPKWAGYVAGSRGALDAAVFELLPISPGCA